MAFTTTQAVWDQMLRWACEHPRVEVTGFIHGVPGQPFTHTLRPMQNVHPRPGENYSWSPDEARQALDEMPAEHSVLAIYHSHPNYRPDPSETDQEAALWVGAHYIILTPRGRGEGRAYLCPGVRLMLLEEVELV
jgi:proteasome lid subunit RPN8/RPN11